MKNNFKKITLIFVLMLINTQFTYAVWNGTPETDINDFKFMVSIQIINQDTKTWEHYCGGSLISPTFVLTAGHCGADVNGKPQPVNLAQIVTRNGDIVKIKSINIHPKFYWQPVPAAKTSLAENDFSLFELTNPVTNEDFVQLPTLNDSEKYYKEGTSVISIGYGWYDMRCDPYSLNPTSNSYCVPSYPILRSAKETYIVPYSQLQWVDFAGQPFSAANPYINNPLLFIGTFNNTKALAPHDSGSPLLVRDSIGKYVIIGTDSSGVSVPQKYQPESYTKLATKDNLDWIYSVINPQK